MGILPRHIHVLAAHAKQYAGLFSGDVLALGQQSVHVTLARAERILVQHGFDPYEPGSNTTNSIPQWKGTTQAQNTNATGLFRMLGASNVFCCDVSDYENPDFLIDLNDPYMDNKERFDVIFDAGTLGTRLRREHGIF